MPNLGKKKCGTKEQSCGLNWDIEHNAWEVLNKMQQYMCVASLSIAFEVVDKGIMF